MKLNIFAIVAAFSPLFLIGVSAQALSKIDPNQNHCSSHIIENKFSSFKEFIKSFNAKSLRPFEFDVWYKFTDFAPDEIKHLVKMSHEAHIYAVIEDEQSPISDKVQYISQLTPSYWGGSIVVSHLRSRWINGDNYEISRSFSEQHYAIQNRCWENNSCQLGGKFMIPGKPEFQDIIRNWKPKSLDAEEREIESLFNSVAPIKRAQSKPLIFDTVNPQKFTT